MKNSNKPYIKYELPPKAHFLTKIAFGLIAALIVFALAALVKEKRKDAENKKLVEANAGDARREIKTGGVLHSRFFDVMVDKVVVAEKIVDRPALVNLSLQEGNQYLVIEIILKNMDAESQMMPGGELRIESGSKELKYEKSETLLKEGWGELMENIAPGAVTKTRLVYKIPAGISGKAYYYPDIMYNEDRILLKSL